MIKQSDVLQALQRHIGRENGQRADHLVKEITGGHTCPASERRLRHVITDLRMAGHHICAHPSAGYYIASNDTELNQTCEFLYERAMSSLAQISRMKRISLPDLRGQLRLPT